MNSKINNSKKNDEAKSKKEANSSTAVPSKPSSSTNVPATQQQQQRKISENNIENDEEEKSESKKIERQRKDKFTNIIAKADARLSATAATTPVMTDADHQKLVKELQEIKGTVPDGPDSKKSKSSTSSKIFNIPISDKPPQKKPAQKQK